MPDTESRLGQVTELMATAIAKPVRSSSVGGGTGQDRADRSGADPRPINSPWMR
jgi:hypothetical protein